MRPSGRRCLSECARAGRSVPVVRKPLSAQAHAPSRPSGADKKEIENKGCGRQSLRSRPDRADIAANRHVHPLHRQHRVMQNSKRNVDPARRDGLRSNGNQGGGARAWMRMNMSARVTYLLAILCASAGTASAACSGAIGEFETIINSDAETGNLNKG